MIPRMILKLINHQESKKTIIKDSMRLKQLTIELLLLLKTMMSQNYLKKNKENSINRKKMLSRMKSRKLKMT
jgi:hypothetical protein